MPTYEEMVLEKVNAYLEETRSQNIRNLTRQIVGFLVEKRKEAWQEITEDSKWSTGWTRSGTIFDKFKDEHPRTITRLLQKLSESGIIERKDCSRVKGQPGKSPVFYRVPVYYNPVYFKTREELIQSIETTNENLVENTLRYGELIQLYREKTGEDPKPIIKERVIKLKAAIAENNKKLENAGIKEINPCETL